MPASPSACLPKHRPQASNRKVEFYRGSLLLATATSAPYAFDWTDVASGTYVITAKAYDTLGAETTSAAATVSVSPVATVTITPAAPTAGSPATVTVDGAAACTAVNVDFGDGTDVQTFINGAGLPISNAHTWAATGPTTITATGLGGDCDDTASTSTTVLTPPVIGMWAPNQGAIYAPPATIGIGVTAYPGQGTIASVAFYANGSLIGTTSTNPYTFTWTNVPEGTYTFTATVTDTAGATATSGSVSVVVGTPPPSTVLSVNVSPATVAVGQPATVNVTGTNPCGMLWMDFGDGDWWIAPITGGLPQALPKTWTTPGTYTVMAKGFNDCTGQATATVTVTGGEPSPASDTVPGTLDATPTQPQPESLESDEATAPAARLAAPAIVVSPSVDDSVVVDLNGSGGGSVTGTAPCSGTVNRGCGWSIPDASAVALTATASAGSVFTGWSGVCTGTGPTCSFTAFDGALAVANFRAAPAPVLQYYHLDTLGSVRAVTDASGAVVERHDYRPFGEDNAPLPAPGANPARFLGEQRDQTKLDYFGARYLDMHTGRFTGVDPVLSEAALYMPQRFNRYAYAVNNPLRFADTTGMDTAIVRPMLPGAIGGGGGDGDDNEVTEDSPREHPDPGLATATDGNARENAVCMGWDEQCGTIGFWTFVAKYEAARDRDADGFFASVDAGPSVTIDLNNPQAGETDEPKDHIVVVSYWPDGADGFGHIGIGLDTYETSGFSTLETSTPWFERMFLAPRGNVEDDFSHHLGQIGLFRAMAITEDQYNLMLTAFNQRVANPGRYNLELNACPGFVEDVLRAGGIYVGSHIGPWSLWNEVNHIFGGKQ